MKQVHADGLAFAGLEGSGPARRADERSGSVFSRPCRFEPVDGAGHFLHREQTAALTRLVLQWLARA